MRIIGIDPGINFTGWAVIESASSKMILIDKNFIAPKKPDNIENRLLYISLHLTDIIKKYQPNHFALEETFVNVNASTSLILGQARGAILLTAALNHLEVLSYSANQVKKTVCGAGHASKEQIEKMLKMYFPTAVFSRHDEADAVAIAMCACFDLQTQKHMQKLPRAMKI